jgi:predicted nuclease of predicted toxin-antitoxin system
MKLLFDQNLSFRLPSLIADILPAAAHVRDFGMTSADDGAVWDLARDQQFTITSKDDDFRERVRVLGHPPRVVQLKLGNCSTRAVESALRRAHPQILRLHQDPAASLLIITNDAALILLKHNLASS